ncbi:Subtilisin-like protease [Thalictrum thalictroides]|uniref:Subtilisin-like protease n=1 Tax=Thalictrum thalictroides TaxID=46969 RepID=A0A7J6VQ07_THATH|nr:Subtilisin-like protease [Thalictrum thalictroides]
MSSSSHLEQHGSYIIHMDKSAIPAPFLNHDSWYASTLASLSNQYGNAPIHLYTYKHVLDGFSAVLSKSHLDQLVTIPGHIATYPEQFGQLHTTHTSKFLGLKNHAGLWPAGSFGDDMIIGIIDSGIWPESESFNDHGMPPVPSRWRGNCERGTEFNSSNCNRKLIGARSFSKAIKQLNLTISMPGDYDSPRDFFGHGTHTSSTAAGSRVENVDYFGYAKGTATGVAPLARLAMYKVLFLNDTLEAAASDTLAGMDQAIEDGVDLMSLSLGFQELTFADNPIAVGSFAAMEKGIFVSCSAANDGPESYTIQNGAPWITTVGAGTVDRSFLASVKFSNGVVTITGKSFYPEDLLVSGVSLYHGHDNASKNCENNSLDSNDVSMKIVFCSFNNKTKVDDQMEEVYRSGAKGAIFATDSAQFLFPQDFYMPFVAISPIDGGKVEEYLTTSLEASVDIKFQITKLGTKPAPQVADFSSRGPSKRAPWVLKPDILAPGVDILAAWVPNRREVPIGDDYLFTDYTLSSGTSMASPHVVGVAALLKSAHRDWSSAAIRSAMMTTADVIDNANGQILDLANGTSGTPLDFGSGHINPNKALDPGLVYEIKVEDYVNFLCALNYTSQQIKVITRRSNYRCDQANLDLNYPSFIVILNNTNTTRYVFKRMLTNVVDSQSVYRAAIWAPSGMKVVVEPMTLTFGSKYSKAGFTMEVEIDLSGYRAKTDYIGNYGYLSWYEVDGKHVVRSPIVSAFAI